MTSQTERTSDKGKESSLLPVHSPKDAHTKLIAKYRAADAKLLQLEEELDVLLYCARSLRDERTELTQGKLKYSNDLQTEASLEGRDDLIKSYLALADKSEAVDKAIKVVKKECASSRSECNYLVSKIPKSSFPAEASNEASKDRRRALHDKKTLPLGGPESGFVDREAVAERILQAESTALGVGGVVGAFGAGITYTTLFATSRGRLDLISWAFTCFLMVVIDCAALQLFTPPRHGQITKIFRMEYSGSAEQKMLFFVVLVGVPMVSGLALLGVSVALVDSLPSNGPPSGSRIAIRAAGYFPVAVLGYFVIAMIITGLGAILVRILPWSTEHIPEENRKYYASLLFAVKDKLFFLPGGPGYHRYRKLRRDGGNT